MNQVADAVFQSWQFEPWAFALILLTGVIYVCGWRKLRWQMPRRFGTSRLVSFLSGLAVIIIAIASPLDAFAGLLLVAHMIQHLLLLMVAPPLILYGAPYVPLLRGLPPRVLKHGTGPFLASPGLQKFGRWLTHPLVCWLTFTITSLTWHLPQFYELALRSPFWHEVEHLCFLGAAMLFWWPVIQPWPSRAEWPRWAMIPYLLLADFQNTALAAFLIFCDRVVYPSYAVAPRLLNLSPLADQAAAGAVMWVPGSVVYLIPVGLVTIQVLGSSQRAVRLSSWRYELPVIQPKGASTPFLAGRRKSWDLLSVRIIGAALRRPAFRRIVQSAVFALALIVIADGLFGHQMSSMNLAGVLPWTHWRGLVVISLLVAGNFFCMACPFTLVRDCGRRWLPARWRWPKRLRSKWLAAGLLAVYLWAYEAFSLWDSPWWTAWIVIGYFVASFLIDGLFRGASFCKYVCPIGQFNFVQSLVSPLEVKVRDSDVCRTCTTYDCIRGNDAQRGCELALFQPKKSDNLDCTFCLDCVHACPHQNVGIIATTPGSQLYHRYLATLGRLSQRTDVAALVLLVVFGAFVNAAGMIGPVADMERTLQQRFGLESVRPVTSALFVLALLVVPLLLTALCGVVGHALSGGAVRRRELISSFALTLIPLGLSMWVAHLAYHLLTGAAVVMPVSQRVASDLGSSLLGRPDWAGAATLLALDWLSSLQILLLDGGLLLTLYAVWRVAQRFSARARGAFRLLAPWGALAVLLYAAGVWIVFQPMEMRGLTSGMQAGPMSSRMPGMQH